MTVSALRRPDRLRIALVEFYGVGGTGDYTACLAQSLAARGHEVAVITSSLFEPMEAAPDYTVMRVFHYRSAEPKLRKAMKFADALGDARNAVRSFMPDVIHAQGTVMPVLERSFYRGLAPARRVCTVHDVQGHEWRPWLGSFSRFYATFDALVCHSRASMQRLRAQLPAAFVTVIAHGRYSPLATALLEPGAARAALNLPDGAHVVLVFGFIRPYKGLELFLQALAIARDSDPAIVAMIVGRPLYDIAASRRQAEVEELPVRWDLRFIPRDEMAQYFAAADVVALPYVDTSDSGMIELAAAFGKPVVATATGGLVEAFRRYGVGAVVPPRDAVALASAIVQRYEPPPAVSPASNSWDEVATQTESLYSELLDADRVPASHTGAA